MVEDNNNESAAGENMQKLRVETISAGSHPSEVVVGINTRSGTNRVTEEMIIDREVLNADGTVDVGYPLARQNGSLVLIELPRETIRGAWRVWVSNSELK